MRTQNLVIVSAIIRFLQKPCMDAVAKITQQFAERTFFKRDTFEIDRVEVIDKIQEFMPPEDQEELTQILGEALSVNELIQEVVNESTMMPLVINLTNDSIYRILLQFSYFTINPPTYMYDADDYYFSSFMDRSVFV